MRILLRVIVWCLIASSPALAANQIWIETPTDGTLVQPGQAIKVVIQQDKKLAPAFFNRIGLMPTPLIAGGEKVEDVDPYILSFVIPKDLGPGTYPVIGYAGKDGGKIVQTDPIFLTISFGQIAELRFDAPRGYFEYVGESRSYPVKAFDKEGRQVDLSNDERGAVEYSTSAPKIAIAEKGGAFTATGSGEAWMYGSYKNLQASMKVSVMEQSMRGDLNADGAVDSRDVEILRKYLNTVPRVKKDARDLSGDGKIDALDLRVLTTLCTRPRCATQ